MMSNPDIMRQLMMANPQMREIMEVNYFTWTAEFLVFTGIMSQCYTANNKFFVLLKIKQ
jgi:malic enzyme